MPSLKTIYETCRSRGPPTPHGFPHHPKPIRLLFSSLYTSMVTKNKFFSFPARLTPRAPGLFVDHTHRDCHTIEKLCINCTLGQTSIEHLLPSAMLGKMPLHKNSENSKMTAKYKTTKIRKHCENNNERNNSPGQTCHKLARKAPS